MNVSKEPFPAAARAVRMRSFRRSPQQLRLARYRRRPVMLTERPCEEGCPAGADMKINKVSIEYHYAGITSIIILLPQLGNRGNRAMAYTFSTPIDKQDSCELEEPKDASEDGAAPLPSNAKKKGRSIVKARLAKSCSILNEVTQPSDRAKATLKLSSGVENDWLFFTIYVNVPGISESSDMFEVALMSGEKKVIRFQKHASPLRTEVWTCSYGPEFVSSHCSALCGGGRQFVTRKLINKPPADWRGQTKNCEEVETYRVCNTQPCNLDCYLGGWEKASPCSRTCGKGVQLWRRRVLRGPIGAGARCPHWSSAEREKLEECAESPCTAPRCGVSSTFPLSYGVIPPGLSNATTVLGRCSSYCGRGVRKVLQPVLWEAMSSCAAQEQMQDCNMEACGALNFFASPDAFPRAGDWMELAVIFETPDASQEITIAAPPHFHIGQLMASDCMISDHNLPWLKACKVQQCPGGLQREYILLTFWNTLLPSETRRLNLWVKHPEDCAQITDANPKICSSKDIHGRIWELSTATLQGQSVIVQNAWSGYEFYKADASLRSDDVQLPKLPVGALDGAVKPERCLAPPEAPIVVIPASAQEENPSKPPRKGLSSPRSGRGILVIGIFAALTELH